MAAVGRSRALRVSGTQRFAGCWPRQSTRPWKLQAARREKPLSMAATEGSASGTAPETIRSRQADQIGVKGRFDTATSPFGGEARSGTRSRPSVRHVTTKPGIAVYARSSPDAAEIWKAPSAAHAGMSAAWRAPPRGRPRCKAEPSEIAFSSVSSGYGPTVTTTKAQQRSSGRIPVRGPWPRRNCRTECSGNLHGDRGRRICWGPCVVNADES